MQSEQIEKSDGEGLEVILDGQPVCLPSGRRSLTAIRSYLDILALERQRILYSLRIDGEPANPGQPLTEEAVFTRVEGETIDLEQMPLQLITAALQQTARTREQVQSAVALVLINNVPAAREFWWKLARELTEPLLTLSLLPETICGPANGRASLRQLCKWQLQQLAIILKDVDAVCWSEDPMALSAALENRVLPWLDSLRQSLSLWHETVLAGSRTACPAI
jgi:hypothetical protein